MAGKTSFSFIVLHIYIITYLILTVIEAPENVMLIMHLLSPLVVVSTLYFILKSLNSSSTTIEEQAEEYKAF